MRVPFIFQLLVLTACLVRHHFTDYVRPKLPEQYANGSEKKGLKGLFDSNKRLTLETVMQMQADQFPALSDLPVPLILPVLTDAIERLQGLSQEGIFRVSGHETEMLQLREHLNAGNYKVKKNKTSNNTAYNIANLLKEFLRNLKEPVIPPALYSECLEAAEDPKGILAIVEGRLPPLNKEVILFVVNWMQEKLLKDDVPRVTKMDVENLSIVFAGCLITCPDDLPMEEILTSMQQQKKFIANLLRSI